MYSVHEDAGLNHKFEVFACAGGDRKGEEWAEILLDP